jgi:hypothetical protein
MGQGDYGEIEGEDKVMDKRDEDRERRALEASKERRTPNERGRRGLLGREIEERRGKERRVNCNRQECRRPPQSYLYSLPHQRTRPMTRKASSQSPRVSSSTGG